MDVRLAHLAQSTGLGAWAFDPRAGVVHLSRGARVFADLDLGRTVLDARDLGRMDPAARSALELVVGRALGGERFEIDLELPTPSGRKMWARISGAPVREGRAPHLVVGTVEDVSGHRGSRTAERAAAQSGGSDGAGLLLPHAGDTARDLNDQLMAVLAEASVALENVEPGSEVFQSLQRIQSASRRMGDLVRHLLARADGDSRDGTIVSLSRPSGGGRRG